MAYELHCFVDNETVCGWLNGTARVEDPLHVATVACLQDQLAEVQRLGHACPWTLYSPFVKAIPRHQNSEADRLANVALDSGMGVVTWLPCAGPVFAATVHSDGASRGNPGPSSCAAILSVFNGVHWLRAAEGSRLLGMATSTYAEIAGVDLGFQLLSSFLGGSVVVD